MRTNDKTFATACPDLYAERGRPDRFIFAKYYDFSVRGHPSYSVGVGHQSQYNGMPLINSGHATKRSADQLWAAFMWLLAPRDTQGRRPSQAEVNLATLPLPVAVALYSLGAGALSFFHGRYEPYTLVRAEGVHPDILPHLKSLGFEAVNVCADIDGFIGLLRLA